MSRTVNGEAFFGIREKEILRKMIHQVGDFSGVEVLTYCVMKNHFHVLVRVPAAETLPDTELVRRFRVLYPKPTQHQALTAADLERIFAENGEAAENVRAQLLGRMGDVSQFMKTLKQRFSIWFNKSRDRFGPVWSDRFKSVLVEGKGFPLHTVAAYIDLNPVRAGLVDDPKDYRFCGYAEAVAGDATSRSGIRFIFAGECDLSDQHALQEYRQLLFGKGGAAATGKGQISRTEAIRVIEGQNGVLPLHCLLRCRVRYLTEGAIIGSAEFVRSHIEAWQLERKRKRPSKIRDIPHTESGIHCINGGHGKIFS